MTKMKSLLALCSLELVVAGCAGTRASHLADDHGALAGGASAIAATGPLRLPLVVIADRGQLVAHVDGGAAPAPVMPGALLAHVRELEAGRLGAVVAIGPGD
ncbi:MAG TPA: hypothetical protein VHE35_27845, partial [Kofleriaceae bacterium]|nr:hypothetical protein [Kofleriaceae bacterium]